MAKIDYERTEYLFDEGFQRWTFEHLLYLADLAASFGEAQTPEPKKTKGQIKRERNILMNNVKREVMFYSKKDKGILIKLGVKKADLKRLLDDEQNLSDDEIEELKNIQDKIRQFRKEIYKSLTEMDDEKIIKQARKKSKNFRPNIRDTWLPLH